MIRTGYPKVNKHYTLTVNHTYYFQLKVNKLQSDIIGEAEVLIQTRLDIHL